MSELYVTPDFALLGALYAVHAADGIIGMDRTYGVLPAYVHFHGPVRACAGTGADGGVFYVEIKNGVISVEPFEYIDRNCEITISMDNFVKLMEGKLDPIAAFTLGKLKVNGDIGKALDFAKIIK